MGSPCWFSYDNEDIYRSYNVVFGDKENLESWTEVLECQTEIQADTLVDILNRIGAGPYQDTALMHTPWQESLREGKGDIRAQYLGVKSDGKKSGVR